MPDAKVVCSEVVDTGVYAFRIFPAIAGLLAAMAIYPHVRKRLAGVPPGVLSNIPKFAVPAAGAPGLLLIVLRLASVSSALNPYFSIAGALLVCIAAAAAASLRWASGDAHARAAAVLSAAGGAAVFLLSMLLMLGIAQVPALKDPMVSVLGIAVPAGLTLGLAALPIVRRVLASRPAAVQNAAAAGAGAASMLVVAGIVFLAGVPERLPNVSVVAMTAFPLAAAAGLKAARHVPLGTYSVLFALRMIAVAWLVMFIARPALSIQTQQAQKPRLIFAIDTSASMSARDGENVPTRLDWVKQALGQRYLDRLRKYFDLGFLSFSAGAEQVPEARLAALAADGKSTDLAAAVIRAKAAFPGDDISSVVLVSDGIDNATGRDAVKAIVEQGLVVNTIGVGALADEKGKIKDIAVKHVESPRYTTVNNVAEVKAYIESAGIVGRISVLLKRDGKEIADAKLFLEAGASTQVATLRFTPDTVGHFEFEIAVPPEPEERLHQNNTYPFSIIVTDPRIRVIYVEGTLRWEYKYLKRTLDMDPNIELLSLVQTRKDVFLKQGSTRDAEVDVFPRDLDALRKFDVIVIGDLDQTLFSPDQLAMIQQAVKDRAGFLMLGGQASFGPGGYAGTPIAELLPVEIGGRGDRQLKDAFTLQLTDDGKAHPIFAGTLDFFGVRDEAAGTSLPDLGGNTEVLGAKPGATVLAVNPDKTGHDGKPLIVAAVQQYGAGRTMAFTADTTWRWLLQMKGLGRETPYVKFWGQAIRWLANQEVKEREQKPGITVFSDKRSYEPAEEVRLFGRARAEGGLATNDAVLQAVILTPSGARMPLQLTYVPGTTGEYEGKLEPTGPGAYAVTVNGSLNQQPLGEAAELSFRVGSPNLEFDELDLNETLLKRIAEETGGRYHSLVQLDDLLRTLQSAESSKRGVRQVSLWDYCVLPVVGVTRPIGFVHRLLSSLAREPQGLFLTFLVVVAAEWTIRKRRLLS